MGAFGPHCHLKSRDSDIKYQFCMCPHFKQEDDESLQVPFVGNVEDCENAVVKPSGF